MMTACKLPRHLSICLITIGLGLLSPAWSQVKVEKLNTVFDEFSPSYYPDGSCLFFNSNRGGKYSDIYLACEGKEPRPLAVLNSPYHDESPRLSGDGKTLVFASDRDGSTETGKDRYGRIRVSFDIYISRKQTYGWSPPRKVAGQVNTAAHERSPALNYDGTVLYFNRWSFGNMKDSKIYSAELKKNEFVNARPLPPSINAGFQEAGLVPVWSKKREIQGFYFSSRRPGGPGGWDIYFIDYENGRFGKPVLVPPPVNSPANEVYLGWHDNHLYFASNRPGGKGAYDLYEVPDPVAHVKVRFTVFDEATKKPLAAKARLYATVGKNEISVDKNADSAGRFSASISPNLKKVFLNVQRDGYLPLIRELTPAELEANEEIPLPMKPEKKDAAFTLHSIHFDYNSAKIKPESIRYLKALAEYLSRNQHSFEIIGHTDLHGSNKFNLELSLRRAKAVRDYLINSGISGKRLSVKGLGKSRPVVAKEGEPFDSRNRRTEFRLLH